MGWLEGRASKKEEEEVEEVEARGCSFSFF